jgi:hypothetical protein
MGVRVYLPIDWRDTSTWKLRNTALNNSGREIAAALQNAKYTRGSGYYQFAEQTYPTAIGHTIGWDSSGVLSTHVADPANVLGQPDMTYDEDHILIWMLSNHEVSGIHGLYGSDTGATPAEDNKVTWKWSGTTLDGQMTWHDGGNQVTKLDIDVTVPNSADGSRVVMTGVHYRGADYTARSFVYHPDWGYLEGTQAGPVTAGDRLDWGMTWGATAHSRLTLAISGATVNPKYYGFAWIAQPASENRFADRAVVIPELYTGWLANNKRLPARWTGSQRIYR